MTMGFRFNFFVTLHLLFITYYFANVHSSRTKPPTSINFSIASSRNATGYRSVKTNVVTSESLRQRVKTLSNILIDVEQSTYVVGNRRNMELSTTFVVLEPQESPPGYELMPGLGWYRLHLTPLTWEEARLACEAEDAHLAVLNSQEEADALKGIFAKAPSTIHGATWSSLALIGISDTAVEGTFVTIFGESLQEAGFANWENGQPNNAKTDVDPKQDCGAIDRTHGKLHDVGCRGKAAYFCEYAL